MEKKLMKFRNLIGEAIGIKDSDMMKLIFDIRKNSL